MKSGRLPRVLLPVVAVAVGLTGCSSSSTGANAGAVARPDDACLLLNSDQVAGVVGVPGEYTGAHEDPAEDGSPVWGCTWGTHTSYADLRELPASQFNAQPDPSLAVIQLTGIGAGARLEKQRSDGDNPFVRFSVSGKYYEAEVTVDRRETDAHNAPREADAEQALAKLVAPKL